MSKADLQTPHFTDADKAREYLEAMRWADGVYCPHCGVVDNAAKLEPKPKAKAHARKGVWQCRDCRKQFTATVGTIFEGSHIPLNLWFLAIHLMCSSKKGMSAHQLHRMLGVTYKSAWFMAHRIRFGMTEPASPLPPKMTGTVEVDETYIGGKAKGVGSGHYRGPDSKKIPVVALVQRQGGVRSFVMERVTIDNVTPILKAHIALRAHVNTDDSALYRSLKLRFPSHRSVNHSIGEYVRSEHKDAARRKIHTNTVEGFFPLVKRGIYGTFHHVSKQHLHRYLAEFDYRYNNRDSSDGERALEALKGFEGKRLTYQITRHREQSQA